MSNYSNNIIETEKGIYNKIVRLRSSDLAREVKERDLELLIRELPTWEKTPPFRSATRKRFQDSNDSIYLFQNESYLISVSAEEWDNSSNSESWRLYAEKLKSNELHQGFVGIFFSLYDVDTSIVEESIDINKHHLHNLIIDGDYWDELQKLDMPFSDFLNGTMPGIRNQENTFPPKLSIIQSDFQNRRAIQDGLLNYSQEININFLNTFEIANHDDLYVRRKIDESIKETIYSLRPSKLKRKATKEFYEDPKQTNLIRDYAGSGKTTLSTQIQRLESICIPICISASEQALKEIIADLIDRCSLESLTWIDQPVVVVIDSLDEVKNIQNKQKEVLEIFRLLQSTNKNAKRSGFASFPIAVFFTVRDDYFKEWESIFEGSIDNTFKRRISRFSQPELNVAIEKYSKVFRYEIRNKSSLNDATKEVLSVPINLAIFSESQKHKRDVYIDDIWEAKLLNDYFEQKKMQLKKRQIAFTYDRIYFLLLSKLASHMIASGDFYISKEVFENFLIKLDPGNRFYAPDFWHALHSEEILAETSKFRGVSSFKYLRFLEFLIAYYSALNLLNKGDFGEAKSIILKANKLKEISIFRVSDCLKTCVKKLGVRGERLEELRIALIEDEDYLRKQLKLERGRISYGNQTNQELIEQIKLGTSFVSDPEILVDSFFVLAAKSNDQEKQLLVDFFEKAWELSPHDRNKLLQKAAKREFLAKEVLVRKVLASNIPGDWECFLGICNESNLKDEVVPFLNANDAEGKINFNLKTNEKEWIFTSYLLDVCYGRVEYNTGMSENEIKAKPEMVYSIDKEKVAMAFNELKRLYWHERIHFRTDVNFDPLNNLNKSESGELLRNLDSFLIANQFKDSSENLLKFLVFSGKSRLLVILLQCQIVERNEENLKHLYEVITAIDEYELGELLMSFYPNDVNGLRNNLSRLISSRIKEESSEIVKKLYFYEVFLSCHQSWLFKEFIDNPNPIFTIASIKYGNPIGLRIKNLIGIVNNGVDHYVDYINYIFLATEHFDRCSELKKYDSFNRKYEEWKFKYNGSTFSIPLVEELFPELF